MKYIIMCAGEGKRWGNYKNVPKHLIDINGETLIGRTIRLLKENGIEYKDIVITYNGDERYNEYGQTILQSCLDCEIDRFEDIKFNDICYLYGDVYYSEEAIKTILNNGTDNILFFGSDCEIFAIKVKNTELFFKHKAKVKELYLSGKIDRCIGWEIYRSLNGIPFEEHVINNMYIEIMDETDDIDFPEDYEKFLNKRSNI